MSLRNIAPGRRCFPKLNKEDNQVEILKWKTKVRWEEIGKDVVIEEEQIVNDDEMLINDIIEEPNYYDKY